MNGLTGNETIALIAIAWATGHTISVQLQKYLNTLANPRNKHRND